MSISSIETISLSLYDATDSLNVPHQQNNYSKCFPNKNQTALDDAEKSLLHYFAETQSNYQKAKTSITEQDTSNYLELAKQNREIFQQLIVQEQESLKQQKLFEARITNQLNLHNFTLQKGQHATQIALTEWWDDEIAARLDRLGNIEGGGYRAGMVGRLTIVTGRKQFELRKSVKGYLIANEYIFDECKVSYAVWGKRQTFQ